MKKITLALSLTIAATFAHAAGSAGGNVGNTQAIAGLVNTGANLAAGQQDSNYAFSVITSDTSFSNIYGYVANDSWPIGPWLANSSVSKWLSPTPTQAQSFDAGADGVYDWKLTFDLSGQNAASASFSGLIAADNYAIVELNGVQIGSSSGYSSFSSFAANSGFNAGLNTIDFIVTNERQAGGNPSGLNVRFTDSSVAVSPVPEPETYGMLLAGLAMLGAIARRRKA